MTSRSDFTCAALACLVSFPLLLPARAALAVQERDVPVVRAGVSLVQIAVIAHSKGRAIADLTLDDFVVQDQGKRRSIAVFSVARRQRNSTDLPPRPVGTFANLAHEQTGRPSNAAVVLLDGLNTRLEYQAFARRQFIDLLKQIDPESRVAVYFLGRSLHVVCDFSHNAADVARLLARFRGESPAGPGVSPDQAANSGVPEMDQLLDQIEGIFRDYTTVARVRTTVKALETVAGSLLGVPGRKSLIWVSSGFPFSMGFFDPAVLMQRARDLGRDREMRIFSEELEHAARRLNQAGVAIYPVDAGGLAMSSSFKSASSGFGAWQWPGDARPGDAAASARSAMEELARRTGGRAFFDTNGLGSAIRQAMDDSEVAYALGFYVPAEDLDDRFHNVRVTTRRKGVELRHRTGYFAFRENQPPETQTEQMLRDAVASPLEMTGMPVSVRVERQQIDGAPALGMLLNFGLGTMTLRQNGQNVTGVIVVAIAQQDREGRLVDLFREPVDFSMSAENYKATLQSGLTFGKTIRMNENAAAVRVIVLDRASGAVGSLIVPLAQVR